MIETKKYNADNLKKNGGLTRNMLLKNRTISTLLKSQYAISELDTIIGNELPYGIKNLHRTLPSNGVKILKQYNIDSIHTLTLKYKGIRFNCLINRITSNIILLNEL